MGRQRSHTDRNLEAKLERIRRGPITSHLDLSGLELQRIPPWALERELMTLALAGNKLASLPDEIALQTFLVHLDLRYNRFDHVPNAINDLHHLQELWLDGNQIRRLPDWLGALPALQYVQAHANPIDSAERARVERSLAGIRIGW